MHHAVSRYALRTLAAFLVLVPLSASAQPGALVHRQPAQLRAQTFEALLERASQQPTVRVIVGLGVAFRPDADLSAAERAGQRRALVAAQDAVVAGLVAPREVTRYAFIPYTALEVDRADLERLRDSPLVVSVVEDVPVPPTAAPAFPLAQSVPLIGADVAWGQGFTGAGWSVAILDTGVDTAHPFVADKIVAEACFSTTSGSQSTSVCPDGQNSQIGTGAGVSCDASLYGCDHGTHVAGIAAGSGASFSGVARDASLIAVQVFSAFPADSPYCSGSGGCVLSYTSDQIEGLEYVYSLRTSLDVASVNMSLGSGYETSTCDGSASATKAAIDQLLGADIATAIASGNDGYQNATGSPGCISTAVTVGSTTKTDGVSYFSNIAPWMDVFAPGSSIRSSVPGTSYDYKSGTSMATPHVAGAFAVLRQAHPTESVEELLARFTSTGVPIAAGSPSQDYPRIQVDDAIGMTVGAPAIAVTPASITQEVSVGSNATQTLTIENGGTAALTFDVGYVAGATVARVAQPQRRPVPALRQARRGSPSVRSVVRRAATNAPSATSSLDLLDDGSFEAGTPNAYWDETSTNFGTPLCDGDRCGSSIPRSGSWWAWFGGTSDEEVATLSQNLAIPAGDAELSFYLLIASGSPGSLDVRLDGDTVFSADETDAAAYASYTPVTIDVSAYADDGEHALSFHYASGAGAIANFHVDDVALTASPAGPAWLSVEPAEGTVDPGSSAAVTVTFDAAGLEAGEYSTVLAIASNDAATPIVEVPITFTVTADNQSPVAQDDAATTDEDTAVTVDLLANDADPDGDALTIVGLGSPVHGAAEVDAEGVVTYTPEADYFGVDVFTYTVADGSGSEASASVTITLTAVNDAPRFESAPVTGVAEGETYTYDVTTSDVEGDALVIAASNLPAWLSLVDAGDGTATLSGTPSPSDAGSYPVTLTVSDGDLDAEQPFTIMVGDVNQPPVAADDEAATDEDVAVTIEVLANDSDADGQPLTVTSVAAPAHGAADVDAEGAITYTPEADYFGSDVFTYTVGDANGGEATATVSVAIAAVNDAPTAVAITAPEDGASIPLSGDADTPVVVTWSAAGDVDGDAVTYRWDAVLGGGDFVEPLLTVLTDETSFETTHGALDAALADAGVEPGESATVEHRVVASDGTVESVGPTSTVAFTRPIPTDAETDAVPTVFAAHGVYPNPSAGTVRVAVDLPWAADVTVEVFDTVGRRVAERTQTFGAGHGQIVSLGGRSLPTGLYVYRLTAASPLASRTTTGRFTILR